MLAITMQKIVFLIFMVLADLVRPECKFPARWHGHWFSGNLGEVNIFNSTFTWKGTCVDKSTHFYLIDNRSIGCYSCMLIKERHHNILQYQESYCGGKDSLQQVCRHLNTAVWFTLIRDNATAASCPFEHAYHFSYNNNTGGFCRDPSSYASPCARDSHYELHFKQCPIRIASYTYNRAIHLECIGQWVGQNNQLSMVGRLNSTAFTTKHEQYRCFIYQKRGTVMYMAMSGDASCWGLTNHRSGPLILEMRQDKFGWPDSTCEYPSWLSRSRWRDLDGTHIYSFNNNSTKMFMADRASFNTTSSVNKAYRCITMAHADAERRQLVLLTFTSRECSSQYQCIKISFKREGVMELHEGTVYSYEPRKCLDENFNNALKKTLIVDIAYPQKCPLPGKRLIRTGTAMCQSYFRIGCNGSSVIDIVSSCSSKPGIQLTCLRSWKENKQTYIIARKADGNDGPANCFIIRQFRTSASAQFTVDPDCNVDTSYILKDSISYTMAAKPDECDKVVNIPDNHKLEIPYDNNNRVKDSDQEFPQDSPYKHVEYEINEKDPIQTRGYRTPLSHPKRSAANHLGASLLISVLCVSIYLAVSVL